MIRIGVLGLEPFLVDKLRDIRPGTEVVPLDAKDVDAIGQTWVDVMVVASEHALASEIAEDHPEPPVVLVHRSSTNEGVPRDAEGPVVLHRPVGSPQLQQALDRSLGTPLWRRLVNSMTIEQDDLARADRRAGLVRTLVGLVAIGWGASQVGSLGWWFLGVLVVYTVARSFWWRLTAGLLALDVVVVSALAMAGLVVTADLPFPLVLLLGVVAAQVGYLASWYVAVAVLTGVVATVAALAAGTAVGPALGRAGGGVVANAVILVFFAGLVGIMWARLERDRRQSRQSELRNFRASLYELSRRQAVVAVSFDIGTVGVDLLEQLVEELAPTAAVVLVAGRSGPLQVVAHHNLVSSPPVRMTWEGPGPDAGNGEVDGGADPELTSEVEAQDLEDLVEQLRSHLPDGTVTSVPAELDGEILGGLVLVDVDQDVHQERLLELGTEAALAFDSIRLFNQLRAFTLDQERARIGRSLHDGVMQTLSHVAIELDRAARNGEVVADAAALGRLREHVLATVAEMRTVVNDLRTVRLDRGLVSALEALAVTVAPAGGPRVTVDCQQVGRLPGDVEEQLLRIAEEAVTNAVRHADARWVKVRLARTDEAVVLQVSDDGHGFQGSRVGERDGGVGLTSMRQRAGSINAGLDVDTGLHGTVVTVLYTGGRRMASSR